MTSQLPVSSLVSATVNLGATAAQAQSLANLLIVGSTDVIDTVQRIRTYNGLTAVGVDFGTTAPEYQAAALWFDQSPQPSSVMIGRWAQAATHGRLIGGALTSAQQAIATWQAVTTGSFNVTIDGVVHNITLLNFSADSNLNGVAATIQAALPVGVTCVWDAAYSRFEFKSSTTGATSSVSFLTPEGTGTDISGMLAGLSTSSGAYVANGIAAESALTAVQTLDATFGEQFYGVMVCGAADTDHTAIAGYIEGATAKHAYGITTQEAGALVSTDTTNIAYQIKQLGYKKTWTQYSSSSPYAIASLLGRLLTTDFNGNNTAITLMYKQEPGVTSENLNATQLAALVGFNCNVFVAYDNNTAIIQPGVAGSGDFIDTIYGADWLAITIQNEVFNLLYTSPTKIPQTDAGNHIILSQIENVCAQGVANGLLGPGTWTETGFGTLNQGDFMPKGFYVYAPPISSQTAAARAARQSVTFQVAAKLAGAIHTASILININR